MMPLLIDTHILLWALSTPDRLTRAMRQLLEDADNPVLFSAASIWEIAIKASLGRQDFAVQPTDILTAAFGAGFTELPISSEIAVRVADLPLHHRDPFDRLLVAHAMAAALPLYTADHKLRLYSELVHMMP